jgi:4-diphosphocytidyl-2-C-methyl-D-erythritol kinase
LAGHIFERIPGRDGVKGGTDGMAGHMSDIDKGAFVETAPAKINLSLRVLGRRNDGYHALESIVAFADVGDCLTLTSQPTFGLNITGPFATAIGRAPADNLIVKTMSKVAAAHPDMTGGHVRLEKNLPVAAGLGGGSADAAAMLRLLQRANPSIPPTFDWQAIAASLGADVPVCLRSTVAHMSGIGEVVDPLPPLPPAFAVLANPRVPLVTAAVFRALNAPPLSQPADETSSPQAFASFDALICALETLSNDLEVPARKICPQVADVLDALRCLDGARLVRMSGSGPTCFALFATADAARASAGALRAAHPGWWAIATSLR